MNALPSLIRGKVGNFSKGQKKIADFILSEYDKAAFMTAAAIGVCTDVSESTVVRFACELGFKGFPELQESMQDMVKSRLTSVQRVEVSKKRIPDDKIIENVLNTDIELIKKTLNGINKVDFDNAVKSINNAKRIYIIGVRSSAPLASFMAFYLNLVYDNVVLIESTSGNEIFESFFRINADDVCIAITFPRYSKQTINSLRFISERKAKIIAITDSEKSTISQYADCLLIAQSDMASFVDSLVAPLSLINALIVAATSGKQEQIYKNFSQLEKVWDKYDVYEKDEMNE